MIVLEDILFMAEEIKAQSRGAFVLLVPYAKESTEMKFRALTSGLVTFNNTAAPET